MRFQSNTPEFREANMRRTADDRTFPGGRCGATAAVPTRSEGRRAKFVARSQHVGSISMLCIEIEPLYPPLHNEPFRNKQLVKTKTALRAQYYEKNETKKGACTVHRWPAALSLIICFHAHLPARSGRSFVI